MDNRKEFLVEPDSKVRLAEIDLRVLQRMNLTSKLRVGRFLLAASARHRREGRGHLPRVQRHEPAGDVRLWIQAAEAVGTCPRLPLACASGCAKPWRGGDLQPITLRERLGRARPRTRHPVHWLDDPARALDVAAYRLDLGSFQVYDAAFVRYRRSVARCAGSVSLRRLIVPRASVKRVGVPKQ